MNGFTNLRKCVKCPEPGTLCGLDPSKASYCKSCFIQMVKHKFSSNIGKRRLYKVLLFFILSLPQNLFVSNCRDFLRPSINLVRNYLMFRMERNEKQS
ncbi:unnamed protein product [Anisakis simplex]|uniref:Cytoplasmic tRNA 2-thiolation protein 2 (inferred by orthology to a C. elegans protein) n=1 Tax=Anisakis simplex TaxID=6269 RepID=A0A0M3J948_ANISI|nr:unnamed protein product [Anisakis simplex]